MLLVQMDDLPYDMVTEIMLYLDTNDMFSLSEAYEASDIIINRQSFWMRKLQVKNLSKYVPYYKYKYPTKYTYDIYGYIEIKKLKDKLKEMYIGVNSNILSIKLKNDLDIDQILDNKTMDIIFEYDKNNVLSYFLKAVNSSYLTLKWRPTSNFNEEYYIEGEIKSDTKPTIVIKNMVITKEQADNLLLKFIVNMIILENEL